MQEVTFITPLHTSTTRDYLARMTPEKPHCCEVAAQFGYEYWDGDRKYGYGGYRYDGRWKPVAEAMIDHYGLKAGDKILDIGCGKGFQMVEFCHVLPELMVSGIDISPYAIDNGMHGIPRFIGNCTNLEYEANSQDFVYSINVFHNLSSIDLKKAVQEMMRVAKPGTPKYVCVESYRNWQELQNLQAWALTCKQFHTPEDWRFLLSEYGYDGDIEFVYFQ